MAKQVVILAAGLGTRLGKPHPKPLTPLRSGESIMRRAVNIPGAVTVIAALLGGALLGVVGALLAIPTAAALLLIIREVWVRKADAS